MIKSIYFMFFVCMFMLAMAGCKSQQKENFRNMNADEFEVLIEDMDNVQCVDVRTAEEYQEGHIFGSVNIDVKEENFANLAEEMLDQNKKIAVYCRSGKRSRKAANILAKKGYTVYNLDKGFLNWAELGKNIAQ